MSACDLSAARPHAIVAAFRNLPVWAKSLIAPAVVLVMMFAMAATALVEFADQKLEITRLDAVAFEGLRQSMLAIEAITDIQTELYHLSSTAANETDKSKVNSVALRLTGRLDTISQQVNALAAHNGLPAVADGIAGYDWAARQMIEFTTTDAAYGVMMMGYAEEYFAELRRLLTQLSAEAQEYRAKSVAAVFGDLTNSRFAFILFVTTGTLISLVAALLVARAIAGPTVRLTKVMAVLADGDVEVEIPDRNRRDEIGAMAKAVGVFRDNMVNERRLASEVIHLAHHDALTDLPNRVLFHESLERALSRARRGRPLALHCLDLDQFKSVNDALGHPVGDLLLQAVSQRLAAGLRETDTVARLGGDEFAVMQTEIESPLDAANLAKRMIEVLEESFEICEHNIVIGASIGIAFAPQDGADADQLLKCADLAMYRAKNDGRGTYRLFHPEMDAEMQTRHALEIDLRAALLSEQLELFFQPLVDLRVEKIIGFEALLRWRHPTRGLVSPDQFIPLAEETGLIVQIGEWVIQHACAAAIHWPDNVKVAVNLSAVQFRSHNLVAATEAALLHSGLPPSRLEFEMTETALMSDATGTLAVLHQFRALGIHIAMDDFGTGYSSLSYLRRFPFDRIKIDQSFVRDLGKQQDCIAIIRAAAALGTDLGIAITAEGVETQQQLAMLEHAGCTEFQGYLFSRPVPGDRVIDLLRTFSVTEVTSPQIGEYASPNPIEEMEPLPAA